MVKELKISEIREKAAAGPAQLLEQLQEYKQDLAELRTAQALSAVSSKLTKIKGVRKGIARVYTVMNQNAKAAVRAKFAGKSNDRLPKELRVKKTRAIRRRLSEKNLTVLATGQKGAEVKKKVARMTLKQAKKVQNTKKIRFAVTAE